MRTKAKVDGNHAAVVDALRSIGCSVQSLAAIGKGCPDLLVGYRGANLLLEVKDGNLAPSKQALTTDQVTWHGGWKGQVHVVRSVEDALTIVTCGQAVVKPQVPTAAVEAIVSRRVGPVSWERDRHEAMCAPRRWYCWLARKAGHSWPFMMKDRRQNHVVAMHHYRVAENRIATDHRFAALARLLLADLHAAQETNV